MGEKIMRELAATFSKIILITCVSITGVNANERICSHPANQDQKKIVEAFSTSRRNEFQELKKYQSHSSNYNDMEVATVDINNDGKKDILYILTAFGAGGSCGYDGGILLNLGDQKWKEILNSECHIGCWVLVNLSKSKFKKILLLDTHEKTKSKCVFNNIKEIYDCN